MLTLGVKPGEYVQIGDDIKVSVKQAKGRLLRLDIVAPREMLVLRGELIEKSQGPQGTGSLGAKPPQAQEGFGQLLEKKLAAKTQEEQKK